MIRLDEGCTYFSETWKGGPYQLFIKLTPDPSTPIPAHLIPEFQRINVDWFKIPLLKHWQIDVYFRKSNQTENIEYFAVKMYIFKSMVIPERFINNIRKSLQQKWRVDFDGQRFDLQPEFYKYKELFETIMTIQRPTMLPLWVSVPRWIMFPLHPTSKSDFEEHAMVQLTDNFNIRMEALPLTQQYFCQQVDLEADEYADYTDRIFLNETGKYLEEGEFSRIQTEFEAETVRVCISALGDEFQLLTNGIACSAGPVIQLYALGLILYHIF